MLCHVKPQPPDNVLPRIRPDQPPRPGWVPSASGSQNLCSSAHGHMFRPLAWRPRMRGMLLGRGEDGRRRTPEFRDA